MIAATFLTSRLGGVVGFEVSGHAGLSESGSDILCAAVSSAVFLTVNTITDVLHVTPLTLRAEDGEMLLQIEQKDEPVCRNIFSGLKLHLTQLEEQYSDHLRVSYLEPDTEG